MAILKQVSVNDIEPNPENPRLIFRQEEMESLMLSIKKHGIQVALSVYKDGPRYFIIDGERRWRCARLLNLRTVPVVIQKKPTQLSNLIMMYNIHALREQWDYFTIASKLTRLIDLFQEERGYRPNEVELSEETGLTRGQIRRCNLIIDLPERFKERIMEELRKPKSQQVLTEDFFIEMEKALKAVFRRLPELHGRENEIRDSLVRKFEENQISSVTDFRMLAKIATSIDTLDTDRTVVLNSLGRVFDPDNNVTIKREYREVVEFEYEERSATLSLVGVDRFLSEILSENTVEELDPNFLRALWELRRKIDRILEASDVRLLN